MWNFSVPAIMKTYIDAITVSGKTFTYTKEGAQGLLKGKKRFTFNPAETCIQKALKWQEKWAIAI